MLEKWSRICFSGNDDYIDVVEDFETIIGLMNNGSNFMVLESVVGGNVWVRKSSIYIFYQHGLENLKKIWAHNNRVDEYKKECEPKEWE